MFKQVLKSKSQQLCFVHILILKVNNNNNNKSILHSYARVSTEPRSMYLSITFPVLLIITFPPPSDVVLLRLLEGWLRTHQGQMYAPSITQRHTAYCSHAMAFSAAFDFPGVSNCFLYCYYQKNNMLSPNTKNDPALNTSPYTHIVWDLLPLLSLITCYWRVRPSVYFAFQAAKRLWNPKAFLLVGLKMKLGSQEHLIKEPIWSFMVPPVADHNIPSRILSMLGTFYSKEAHCFGNV